MSMRALIVEDSATMRKMVTIALEACGDCTVIQAEDGVDALNKLARGTVPSVIITDINMPNMDGISLIRKIRSMELFKDTPILILTSELDQKIKDESVIAGATCWITKPFKVQHLHEVIDSVIH